MRSKRTRQYDIGVETAALIRWLCAAIALAVVFIPAFSAYAVDARVRQACKADYYQYCSQFSVGTDELRQCMRKVGEGLSAPCLVALVEAGEITKADVERHNAKKKGATEAGPQNAKGAPEAGIVSKKADKTTATKKKEKRAEKSARDHKKDSAKKATKKHKAEKSSKAHKHKADKDAKKSKANKAVKAEKKSKHSHKSKKTEHAAKKKADAKTNKNGGTSKAKTADAASSLSHKKTGKKKKKSTKQHTSKKEHRSTKSEAN